MKTPTRIPAVPGKFIARGLISLAAAKSSGEYLDAGEVLARLQEKLQAAQAATQRDARSR